MRRICPARVRGEGVDANAITLRQLLRHQSGLPEYFDDDTPVPADPVTADRLLDAALARPVQFAPGSALKYTNTNYVIAGLLIEKATGHSAADEITKRIIVPLGLPDTYFPRRTTPGCVHRSRTDTRWSTESARTSRHSTRPAGMAGSLISTNDDTATFITALLDGRVIPSAQLREMMDTVDWTDAGAGFPTGWASPVSIWTAVSR